MSRRTWVVSLAALTALGALVLAPRAIARAEIDGDRFRSAEWRVTMSTPRNWQITDQTSYPNILLWMVRHNPPGTMLLSAERVAADLDAQAYATATIAVLETMGFEVRSPQLHGATGAYWVDFDNGAVFLRQAFLVTGGFGYALTLSAQDARGRTQHLRSFDQALRSIRPDRSRDAPAEPEPETDTAPQPAGDRAEGAAP